MSGDADLTEFVTLVEVTGSNVQNVQEMASVWGRIRNELDEIGASVEDAYAVLGEVDFLVIYEAPSTDVAFQADVILERHGLSVQTMEAAPTERFSELVEDV